jgi:hypothetical protein
VAERRDVKLQAAWTMIAGFHADEDVREDLVCVGIEDNIGHVGLGIHEAIPI